MPDSTFTSEHNIPYDWLSDLQPVLQAQEMWNNGTYHQAYAAHLNYHSEGPFAIACGAGLLAEHIRQFRISQALILRLGRMTDENGRSVFRESFLNHLQRLQLRVQVNIAPEGTLLLPGEPILTVQGPLLQVQLLETAFHLLLWQPTHWATRAAMTRYEQNNIQEEDTPSPPAYPPNPFGWKIRAAYIGGASADEILENMTKPMRPIQETEGLTVFEKAAGEPLAQVRRLYKGTQALGDLWLTQQQEENASISKTSTRLHDERTGQPVDISMSRFQNLYQPVLVKGHPVLAAQRLAYLRQRTLKQLDIYTQVQSSNYPYGWLAQ